jgi:hypothetical protein
MGEKIKDNVDKIDNNRQVQSACLNASVCSGGR